MISVLVTIRISEILKLSKDYLVKRNQTGVEMAQSITDLYRTRPNTEWLEFFNQSILSLDNNSYAVEIVNL